MDSPAEDKNIFGIIYCATHKGSGRRYVGQTYSKIEKNPKLMLADRRARHWRRANEPIPPSKKNHFQLALLKYGLDSFEWKILEEATRLDILNARESYYISEFQSSSDLNGFNNRLEGDNRTYAEMVKRKMKKSAGKRWKNMLPEARIALLNKQKKGRDKRPELYEQAAERFRRLHEDREFNEKRLKNFIKAIKSDAHREIVSKNLLEMWKKLSPEDRKKRLKNFLRSDKYGESFRKAIESPEYKQKLSLRSRFRYEHPFDVIDYITGEKIGSFKNIIDASRFFVVRHSIISRVLHRRVSSFSNSRNPDFIGRKLTAHYCDSQESIRVPYDSYRRIVHIYRLDTGIRVRTILGIKSAKEEIGTNPAACLGGSTLSFKGKGEWKQCGPLYATFEDKGNKLDQKFIEAFWARKASRPSRCTPDEIILKVKALIDSGMPAKDAAEELGISYYTYWDRIKRIKG
jgi:hypothetical protein